MDLPGVLEAAKRQLAAVTGLKPVTVTRVRRGGEGWRVRVEMLEMTRIPPSTDVLGEYEAVLSEGGELLEFERKRTRLRAEPWEAEAE